MISAVLYKEADRLVAYSAKGHSGYAEAGSDIVCAAVSVLGCTCVNSLEALCGIPSDAMVKADESGALAFELPSLTKDADLKAQVLMGALKQGLTDVQKAYPKYVKFSIKERRK